MCDVSSLAKAYLLAEVVDRGCLAS